MASRNWKFTVGAQTFSFETDFWVEYKATGDPSTLGITLHDIWERIAATETSALVKRQAIEARLLALAGAVGLRGELKIDDPLAGMKTFTGVILRGLNPSQMDNNLILEYTLDFEYPVNALGFGAAAYRRFDATFVPTGPGLPPPGTSMSVTTAVMLVQRSKGDKTVFKELWRHVPVRIPSGDDLVTVRLTGIEQAIIVGGTPTRLQLRQAAEAIIANMLPNVGKEYTLLIDGPPISTPGINEGRVHLLEVAPSKIDLFDAVTYDLVFVKNYVY